MFESRASKTVLFAVLAVLLGMSSASAQGFRWSNGAPMPLPNRMMASAVILGDIYVAGGDPDHCVVTNRAFRYRPLFNTWEELAPMPIAVHMGGGAATGGRFYVVGGGTSCGEIPPTDALQIYDPQTNSWSLGAPLPGGWRLELATAQLDGFIYAIGGSSAAGSTKSGYRYDPVADVWTSIPDAPVAFGCDLNQCAASVDGKIYISRAGADSRMLVFDPATSLDPLTHGWTVKKAYRSDLRVGAALAPFGLKLMLMGGYFPDGSFPDSILYYNTVTDKWTPKPKPLTPALWFVPRAALTLERVGNKLYAIGGQTGVSSPDHIFDLIQIMK